MPVMQIHILRLGPGHDLRPALEAFVSDKGIRAGFILSAIGSLSGARLRLAGRETGTHLPGDLELLTLAGTLAPDGCHLHASVSDATERSPAGTSWRGAPSAPPQKSSSASRRTCSCRGCAIPPPATASLQEQWLAAMARHPILIERPIAVKGERAVVGRPPEKVLELL